MSTLNNSQISEYRKRLGAMFKKITYLATRCLYKDPLIHGSPAEVFRKCGRPGCKCQAGDANRHGPYKVIQVVRNNRSRQICLRKGQDKLWELAKNYQFQISKLAELKQICQDMMTLVDHVIEQRIREFPDDKTK